MVSPSSDRKSFREIVCLFKIVGRRNKQRHQSVKTAIVGRRLAGDEGLELSTLRALEHRAKYLYQGFSRR